MILNFIKGIFGISSPSDLRILMYHQVSPEKNVARNELDILEKKTYPGRGSNRYSARNELVISVTKLEEQLKYISQNFETVFFKELEAKREVKKKLIITFDDGYYNNLVYLVPLLKKYKLKASIGIPTKLIEKDLEKIPGLYMSFDQIKSLPEEHVEIVLHSHNHRNYAEMSLADAERDIDENITTLEKHHIPFSRVLVYPYGKFPKKDVQKKMFFKLLEKKGIFAALRIGNNLTSFPWKNKYEVKRINIESSDRFATFRKKLRFGKIKF